MEELSRSCLSLKIDMICYVLICYIFRDDEEDSVGAPSKKSLVSNCQVKCTDHRLGINSCNTFAFLYYSDKRLFDL